MAKAAKTSEELKPIRPALTPEGRENQMIALATDLVEKRLRDGSASSQETTHYLKQGTMKARLELEILQKEKELITAKTEALQSQKRSEELFAQAIKAFASYSGQESEEEYDEDPDIY